MEQKLEELKRLVQEANDLNNILSLMSWDQSTYMPPGGAAARGRQTALLARLAQEKATDPRIGRLLDELEPYAESLPYDHDEAAMIRAARREFEKQIKLPPDFFGRLSEHQAATFQVWAEARPANDWKKVEPYLEKMLDLSRQVANFFPGYDHIADPLINFSDYGMKAEDVRLVFRTLREELTPLIQKIAQQPQVDDSCLRQHFPKEAQLKFCEEVTQELGYDYQRGRMDLTHHPFTTSFSIDDVRITTRVKENQLSECLFSAFHEAGHAIHGQGKNPAYEASSLSSYVSAGLNESQSRTWENLVARSRDFWEHYYPRLQTYFPEQLNKVDLETFYRAINKVEPSLIRTDADEVTYNLHPMIRFELELALLEGALAVKELPEAWNECYRRDLGLIPPDDRDGVLQDVHWYSGWIGGVFQGYTLGNIISAMFYEKALEAHPEIPAQIRQGQFATLHGWLKENIYWYGAKYTAPEYLHRVTGSDLDIQPYMRYLKHKFGEIYSL